MSEKIDKQQVLSSHPAIILPAISKELGYALTSLGRILRVSIARPVFQGYSTSLVDIS
jgi:hypothetical protein